VLADLIRSRGLSQVLVFTRTKLTAARLARMLEKDGINADAIHGDKSQQERMKALDAFKEGKITALVATDVAARGLDIDQLPLVVNYELPPNAEDYVHRIGRTGRAGASGEAISLVDGDEERLLQDVEKLLKREFPRERANVPASSRRPTSATSRAAPTNSASGRKPAPKEEWFHKPYEPSEAAASAQETPPFRQSKPKRQIAVLLGGLPNKP
jgi:superfamily II DNA/RNA helicase